MESFNVASLHTNVSNGTAMQAILELLIAHEEEVKYMACAFSSLWLLTASGAKPCHAFGERSLNASSSLGVPLVDI